MNQLVTAFRAKTRIAAHFSVNELFAAGVAAINLQINFVFSVHKKEFPHLFIHDYTPVFFNGQ
jgi:hypothetical protein